MRNQMRTIHRYLGFFLAGIMAVYAISGIALVFRNTDAFKKVELIEKTLPENTTVENLGEALGMRRFKVDKVEGNIAYFQDGTYDLTTREAKYTVKELPFLLDKMTHMHKATTNEPLFFLNIFFGLSLFFFVISSFWMFAPGTSIFKKGMYFTIGGIILTLIMIFI